MAGSKSSQTTRNIVIACLALWSIISLIIIVVWATSPDLKGASQCRKELQAATEKHEKATQVWADNKVALEEMVESARQNITKQQLEINQLLEILGSTNASLDDCRQEIVILNENITILETEIEQHKELEANLSAEIVLHKDHIVMLQDNVTQTIYETMTCLALKAADEKMRVAAETQNKACQARKKYLDDQLGKCNAITKAKCPAVDLQTSDNPSGGAATPNRSIPLLAVILLTTLHLVT